MIFCENSRWKKEKENDDDLLIHLSSIHVRVTFTDCELALSSSGTQFVFLLCCTIAHVTKRLISVFEQSTISMDVTNSCMTENEEK
jgi:hypothetical protein